jgi:hypothetical protein
MASDCRDHRRLGRSLSRDAAGNFGQHTRFDLLPLFGRAPTEKTEIDIEGLAVDGGCLWVVGSHSLKRKKAEEGKTDVQRYDKAIDYWSQYKAAKGTSANAATRSAWPSNATTWFEAITAAAW